MEGQSRFYRKGDPWSWACKDEKVFDWKQEGEGFIPIIRVTVNKHKKAQNSTEIRAGVSEAAGSDEAQVKILA